MIINTEFSSMHLYYIMNTGLIVNLTEHSMFIIMTSLESAWSPRAPGVSSPSPKTCSVDSTQGSLA